MTGEEIIRDFLNYKSRFIDHTFEHSLDSLDECRLVGKIRLIEGSDTSHFFIQLTGADFANTIGKVMPTVSFNDDARLTIGMDQIDPQKSWVNVERGEMHLEYLAEEGKPDYSVTRIVLSQ